MMWGAWRGLAGPGGAWCAVCGRQSPWLRLPCECCVRMWLRSASVWQVLCLSFDGAGHCSQDIGERHLVAMSGTWRPGARRCPRPTHALAAHVQLLPLFLTCEKSLLVIILNCG